MPELQQTLNACDHCESSGNATTFGNKKKRRRILRNVAFLLLVLLVIVLVAVIIHLVKSREESSQVKVESRIPVTSRQAVWRPFLRWRQQGTCPPVGERCPAGPRPLLVVSLDGFRPDYLNHGVSPMLQDMLECGVTAPYVRTSFPSKTFPNHYSIVTGMYPESNGIVGNTMYDPDLPGRKFKLGTSESLKPVWWLGEPVWQTVRNMGYVSAVYFWPGSEVPDKLPSHFHPFDSSVPYEERVTQVIEWLRLPDGQRPRYLSLYFSEPDKSGHKYGPDSEQVKEAVARVDAQLASLYSQLMTHDLLGCVDVVVSSDHGMAAMRDDCESVILEDYVPDLSNNSTYVNGPVARLRPHNESTVDQLVARLDCSHPALRVWSKDELPERWHYQHSSRIEPIVATVDQGYGLSVPASSFCLRGMHGWDNDLPDMQSFFVAHGPSFKKNYTSPPFENVQLYSLFQTLLDLPDIVNNATKHSLDHLLISPPSDLTSVGEVSVPPPSLEGGALEGAVLNPCCRRVEHCRCNATQYWLADHERHGAGAVFPVPVSEPDSLLDLAFDGLFVAGRFATSSPTKSYRWLQYHMQRYGCGQVSLSSLADDRQCVFQPQVRPGPHVNCSGDPMMTSLVLTLPGFETYLQRITATMYPMYPEYQKHILPELRRRLKVYWRRSRVLVVLAGPVYRTTALDGSGRTIPSHFFYQLRMCRQTRCSPREWQMKQWILPNKETFRPCEAADKFVDFHEATLLDVERLSGLVLFSGQVVSQPDSAHRSHARFITQLPQFRPPQAWSAGAGNQTIGSSSTDRP